MAPSRPRGVWAWALGVAAFLAVMALLAATFDLGPFKEPELAGGELVARGDEICREAHEAFVDLQRSPPGTAGDAAELTGRLIDVAEDEADELRALNGQPEFEAEVDEYLEARATGIDALRAGRQAAEDRDAQAYADSQADLAASQRDRHRIARQIGFAVCSRPLGPGR